jgi:CheY-like chemotaxis protein
VAHRETLRTRLYEKLTRVGIVAVWTVTGKSWAECYPLTLFGATTPLRVPSALKSKMPPRDLLPLVLLVDDNASVREACGLMCQRSGFRVVQAADAPEALEKALLFRPQAIVLDLVLPSMPGWELARRLRADERTATIPILATSGLAAAEAERKARAAGASHFLAKPFDGTTLVTQIRNVIAA